MIIKEFKKKSININNIFHNDKGICLPGQIIYIAIVNFNASNTNLPSNYIERLTDLNKQTNLQA